MKSNLALAIAIVVLILSFAIFATVQGNRTQNVSPKTSSIFGDSSNPLLKPYVPDWFVEANYHLDELKKITGDSYQTIDEMKKDIGEFAEAANVISHLHNSLPDSTKKEIQKLKTALVSKQVKTFPLLRKAFAKFDADVLWKEDITVSCSGSTINFTGGTFAANRNIAEFEEALNEQFGRFRFKRVTYRWYKDADEFTSYTINSKKDSEF